LTASDLETFDIMIIVKLYISFIIFIKNILDNKGSSLSHTLTVTVIIDYVKFGSNDEFAWIK